MTLKSKLNVTFTAQKHNNILAHRLSQVVPFTTHEERKRELF